MALKVFSGFPSEHLNTSILAVIPRLINRRRKGWLSVGKMNKEGFRKYLTDREQPIPEDEIIENTKMVERFEEFLKPFGKTLETVAEEEFTRFSKILIEEGHSKIAKSFMDDMMHGKSVSQIIKERGKTRLSDEKIIDSYCRDVIEENPQIVKDYVKNPKALEALIGRVMAKTKGQADPNITRDLMLRLLKK